MVCLFQRFLTFNQHNRIKAREALLHPYFTDYVPLTEAHDMAAPASVLPTPPPSGIRYQQGLHAVYGGSMAAHDGSNGVPTSGASGDAVALAVTGHSSITGDVHNSVVLVDPASVQPMDVASVQSQQQHVQPTDNLFFHNYSAPANGVMTSLPNDGVQAGDPNATDISVTAIDSDYMQSLPPPSFGNVLRERPLEERSQVSTHAFNVNESALGAVSTETESEFVVYDDDDDDDDDGLDEMSCHETMPP